MQNAKLHLSFSTNNLCVQGPDISKQQITQRPHCSSLFLPVNKDGVALLLSWSDGRLGWGNHWWIYTLLCPYSLCPSSCKISTLFSFTTHLNYPTQLSLKVKPHRDRQIPQIIKFWLHIVLWLSELKHLGNVIYDGKGVENRRDIVAGGLFHYKTISTHMCLSSSFLPLLR